LRKKDLIGKTIEMSDSESSEKKPAKPKRQRFSDMSTDQVNA